MADRRRRALAATVALGAVLSVAGAPGASARALAGPAHPAADAAPGEWWWSAMGIDELHEHGRGQGVTVAVVDGPIERDVPELAGKVASSSTPCLDPDRPDDLEALRSSTGTGREATHATSMAALIAGTGRGTGPGGRGIRGIAPEATIRHYAVLYDDPQKGDKTCGVDLAGLDSVDEAVADSIVTAVQDGADVVNLSLVSGYHVDLEEALLTAYRAGAIVVAGTTNTGTVEYPGLGNGVVLVNPVDRSGRTTDISVGTDPAKNLGAIGIAAPGVDVMAGYDDGSGWDSTYVGSGSSIATAIVSGGIAAMWSAHPEATSGQILQAVKQNVGLEAKDDGSGFRTSFRRVGSDLPQVTERNPAYGWGIFDPADAVTVDPTTLPKDNPFVRTSGAADPAADLIETAMGLGAASASPSASATPAPSDEPSPRAAPAADEDTGSGRVLGWVLGALVLVALVVLALVLVRRRSRTDDATPAATDPTAVNQGAERAAGRSS